MRFATVEEKAMHAGTNCHPSDVPVEEQWQVLYDRACGDDVEHNPFCGLDYEGAEEEAIRRYPNEDILPQRHTRQTPRSSFLAVSDLSSQAPLSFTSNPAELTWSASQPWDLNPDVFHNQSFYDIPKEDQDLREIIQNMRTEMDELRTLVQQLKEANSSLLATNSLLEREKASLKHQLNESKRGSTVKPPPIPNSEPVNPSDEDDIQALQLPPPPKRRKLSTSIHHPQSPGVQPAAPLLPQQAPPLGSSSALLAGLDKTVPPPPSLINTERTETNSTHLTALGRVYGPLASASVEIGAQNKEQEEEREGGRKVGSPEWASWDMWFQGVGGS